MGIMECRGHSAGLVELKVVPLQRELDAAALDCDEIIEVRPSD